MGNLIVTLLTIAFVLAIYTLLVMLVWNWTIPNIFVGAPHIGFWQSFGLIVLGNLLTGGATATASKS